MSLHSKKFHEEKKEWVKKHLEEIRPLTKEWHKSKEGREWHKKHYPNSLGKIEYKKYKCLVCGKEFKSKTTFAKFCSNNCKSKYRRQMGLDNEIRKCIICGGEFETNKYGRRKTCSNECKYKYVAQNKKNKQSKK